MTPARFEQLLERARSAIPGLAITTDILTGFPGESKDEFQETMSFVERMQFSDAHVFPFSSRPGTAAASLPNKIPSRLAKKRARQVRSLVDASGRSFRQRYLGSVATVLWESAEALGPEGWRMGGLTDNYLRVKATTSRDRWNQLSQVRLQSAVDGHLVGVVLPG
jgi:threonylcarbamoyladenosine tRNA methylthiotransferase MtaB